MRARTAGEAGAVSTESRGGRPRPAIVWGLPTIFWTLFGGFMAIHTYHTGASLRMTRGRFEELQRRLAT